MSRKKDVKVDRTAPDIQECRLIILHTINQAVKDYENFREKTKPEDREIFETADGFLFDDNYLVDWGDRPVGLRKLCDHIEIDLDWLRNQIVKRLDIEFLPDGTVVPDRMY